MPQSNAERLDRVEAALADARGRFAQQTSDRKKYLGAVAIAATMLALHYGDVLSIPSAVLLMIWILGLFFLLAASGVSPERIKSEIDGLESTRRLILGLPDQSESNGYFDSLVNINVENLGAYYALVKLHTARSFKLTSTAGIIGFGLIMFGIALGILDPDHRDLSYLTVGIGIVIEAISGIFFYLYNSTVKQLKEYHDSLLDVQNILLSLKLIDDTADMKERHHMIDKMVAFLVSQKNTRLQ